MKENPLQEFKVKIHFDNIPKHPLHALHYIISWAFKVKENKILT
jgi:hypothetical protein